MIRVYHSYELGDIQKAKQQLLSWASKHFNICCFLDNNLYTSTFSQHQECLLAVGAEAIFNPVNSSIAQLDSFIANHSDWIFGHFSYEFPEDIVQGRLEKDLPNHQFSSFSLFIPEILFLLKGHQLTIGMAGDGHQEVFDNISRQCITPVNKEPVTFTPCISKEEYLGNVKILQDHISRGDCYEINYCQKFSTQHKIDPLSVFNRLNLIAPNPFSAFYKVDDNYLLCASPERYLKKEGPMIFSQPIKGTAPRDTNNSNKDREIIKLLKESSKEQMENVMIVDLVRNDLSKICEAGSVKVDELFGIYSFPYVHQMISTVSGKLNHGVALSAILDATFPMGSMTGAPKRRVMELIKQFEKEKRGIYSGTVGYITPDKNFDFNVVIRSLVYNDTTSQLSFHVGSAITNQSIPEKEYQECLLKGKALMQLFAD